MNKRGVETSTIVILAISLIVLAVLLFFSALQAKTIGSAGNRAAIENWVTFKSSKLGYVQGGGSPPVSTLDGTIEIDKLDDEANKKIADAMVNCWKAFHEGEVDNIEFWKGVDDPFCFPCAKIEFDESLKDGTHELNTFGYFLENEKPLYGIDYPTYNKILDGKFIYDKTIQRDKDMYVFYVATKNNIWERLVKTATDPSFADEVNKRAVAGGVIGGTAGKILPGPGTISGTIVGIGAGTIEAYGKEIFSDNFLNSLIYLKPAQDVNKVCNPKLISSCEKCGQGIIKRCEKDECQGIADVIGASCWYESGKLINYCHTDKKSETIELKSANPINLLTQVQPAGPQQPTTDIKITSDKCKASIGSSEMRALLDTIAWAEGADYNIMYGGEKFLDFSAHPAYTGEMPKSGITKWEKTSTAAGRYQFLKDTYDSLKKKGFFTSGFIPEEQDKAAIDLIISKRQLSEEQLKKAVESNNLRLVWNKLTREWASIPTSSGVSYYKGQSAKSEEQLNSLYYQCYQEYKERSQPLFVAQK